MGVNCIGLVAGAKLTCPLPSATCTPCIIVMMHTKCTTYPVVLPCRAPPCTCSKYGCRFLESKSICCHCQRRWMRLRHTSGCRSSWAWRLEVRHGRMPSDECFVEDSLRWHTLTPTLASVNLSLEMVGLDEQVPCSILLKENNVKEGLRLSCHEGV
jgi:hypothetical protein